MTYDINDALWDAQVREQDRQQTVIDELSKDLLRDSLTAEELISDNSDVIANLVLKCDTGDITLEELGERLMSSLQHWAEAQAARDLKL